MSRLNRRQALAGFGSASLGALLRLGVRVRDAAACEPISNAFVDVWHCGASGDYSGLESKLPSSSAT